MVAIDFDDTAGDALREACRMSQRRHGVVLHLAHVVPALNNGQQTLGSLREESEKLGRPMIAVARDGAATRALEHAVPRAPCAGPAARLTS